MKRKRKMWVDSEVLRSRLTSRLAPAKARGRSPARGSHPARYLPTQSPTEAMTQTDKMTAKERSEFDLTRDFYDEVKRHQQHGAALRSYMRSVMQHDGNPMRKIRKDADHGNDQAATVLRVLESRHSRFDPLVL